jgi:Ribosomal L30 N-terminal domain
LVRTGTTFSIKNLLSTHPGFSLDVRTRHLLFTPDPQSRTIPIDVLTPPFAFIPEAEISEAVENDVGARIVRPAALLNYKISSSYTRSTAGEKLSDWADVEYLIQWHLENSITLQPGAIPNATVNAFYDSQNWTSNKIAEKEWGAIGGELPSMEAARSSTPTKHQMFLPESRLKKLKTQQKIEAERQKVLAEKKVAARTQRETIIQRTAEYVKDYLNTEKEQIHLKRLAKKEGNLYVPPEPKLVFVVRIKG